MRRAFGWWDQHEDQIAKTLFVLFILLTFWTYSHYGAGGCSDWDTCGVGVSP